MSIQSLSVAEGSVLATVVFVLVTVGPFVLIRRVFPAEATEDLKAVASWGALRIGTIHALILALVFTEVRQEYNHLAETIDQEALAIEQLYRSLEQIEGAESEGIRQQLTRYTRMVIDQEWPSLASR